MVVAAAGALLFQAAAASPQLDAQSIEGGAYRLDKVADGVYLAVPSAPGPASANIPVIVNDQDVMLVGTHFSPASARALIGQVKTVSDKPVRFIVNTHYHAPQPAAPRESFPAGVDVIGHDLARRAILLDAAGRPRPAAGIAPPTLGMTTRLAFYRGDREIRILYIGRGHSDNDVVVFLAKERILCTGDLLTGAGLSEAVHGVHTVIHLAGVTKALRAADYHAGNANATRNLALDMYKRGFQANLMGQASAIAGRLSRLDDDLNRQRVLARELEVALVVGRHGHDRAGAVAAEHVVGDEDRDPLAVDRVDGV
jgi:hypothetical protein